MALRDQPYFPLYVDDYLTDEKLNMCAPASQGIYIKILCIMHKSEHYGCILLKQKDKQVENVCLNFAAKLARLLPFTVDEINVAIADLIDEKVLYLDGDMLCQKRMIKDNSISISRAKAGTKGGETTQKRIKKFAKPKDEANSVNEYEDVNEDELTNRINSIKKGVKPKDRIPSLESFIAYGLEKAAANNLNVTRTALSMKYEAWKEAGWVNGNGNEVKNWKASLLNTLAHIVERQNGKPPPPDKDAPVIWTEKDIKDYIENPFISNEAKEAFMQERMRESTNKINIDILTPKKLNA
jgi:uncharacterized protein YdaU (DUF1376 family)